MPIITMSDKQIAEAQKLEAKLGRAEANVEWLALDYGRYLIECGVTDRLDVTKFRALTGVTRSPRALWSYVLAVLILPDGPEYAEVNYTSRKKLVTAHVTRAEAAAIVGALPRDERNGAPLSAAVREYQLGRHPQPRISLEKRPVSLLGERYVPGSNESWYTVTRADGMEEATFTFPATDTEDEQTITVPIGTTFVVR